MSDRFHPLSMEQLTDWAFTELEQRGSLFGVPRTAFFVPRPDHRFRRREYGLDLETPFGVAAGPHTQMAQNIVAAWLVRGPGDRAQDDPDPRRARGQQALHRRRGRGLQRRMVAGAASIHESFDEYLRAWVLVHALHRLLGFPGERPGVLFDMSVGLRPRRHPAPERRVVSSTRWPTPRPTCRTTWTSSPGAGRPSGSSTSRLASRTRSPCRRCTAARPTRSSGSHAT